MKWFDWNTSAGLPHRISKEPKGYTLSYREGLDPEAHEGIMEAWYNAGTDKDPKPVFIGQVRGFDRAYRPAKKEAAAELAAACEKHAAQLLTRNSV